MAGEALDRIRSARATTFTEKTARVRLATFAPGVGIDSAPLVDAVGIGDFGLRRVLLESRPTEEDMRRLRELAVKMKQERELEELDQARLVSVDLFDGDRQYGRTGLGEHWVRDSADWHWRPLWALDALNAAAGDWVDGQESEVHGQPANCYSGEIDASLLQQIDRHWQKVLGRRGQRRVRLHVWLDDDSRALRVAWRLPPYWRQKDNDQQWYLSEFWDFGVPVRIDLPPAELVQEPATTREMIRDIWAARKAAKS
jgi:hypothetical protein